MLEVNTETVCFIIAKAREFHSKEEVTIPEEPGSPADDWALQVLADHTDDFCVQEMTATVDDLDPDQQIQLVALMWVGRGDFDKEEWEEAIREAKDGWTPRTGAYLMAHPMLADYLLEGLDLFGHSCEE